MNFIVHEHKMFSYYIMYAVMGSIMQLTIHEHIYSITTEELHTVPAGVWTNLGLFQQGSAEIRAIDGTLLQFIITGDHLLFQGGALQLAVSLRENEDIIRRMFIQLRAAPLPLPTAESYNYTGTYLPGI